MRSQPLGWCVQTSRPKGPSRTLTSDRSKLSKFSFMKNCTTSTSFLLGLVKFSIGVRVSWAGPFPTPSQLPGWCVNAHGFRSGRGWGKSVSVRGALERGAGLPEAGAIQSSKTGLGGSPAPPHNSVPSVSIPPIQQFLHQVPSLVAC